MPSLSSIPTQITVRSTNIPGGSSSTFPCSCPKRKRDETLPLRLLTQFAGVRIFLAEKGLSIPLVTVDLGKGEQHSDAYRAINPRRVVPTLVLEDGTAIGEVPAICRYIEEVNPAPPLLGETAKEKAEVSMWERRAELEGFATVMEAIRNAARGL